MRTLKKEFTFPYKKQEIKVQLVGSVYCAIFGTLAKPLIIEGTKIFLRETEGPKYLAMIPKDAYQPTPTEILKQIKSLLNSVEL